MRLSTKGRYAVTAMLDLALNGTDGPVTLADISENQGISLSYLEQLFAALPTLWNAEARFRKSYLTTFEGYYETGDAGMIDEDGYLYIMSRTDDVINVAGHRLSTGAMEEVLANHPDVAECAVIGVSDTLKGQLPVGFPSCHGR